MKSRSVRTHENKKRPCKHAYRTMVIARMTFKPIYNSYFIPNNKRNVPKNEGFSIFYKAKMTIHHILQLPYYF